MSAVHLTGNTVAITVMSNLGFRLAMEERGIGVVETAVGDRQVVDALESGSRARRRAVRPHRLLPLDDRRRDPDRPGLLELLARTGRPLGALARGAVTRCRSARQRRHPPTRAPRRQRRSGRRWPRWRRGSATWVGSWSGLGDRDAVRVMVEARVEAQADAVAAQLAGGRRGGPGADATPQAPSSLGRPCAASSASRLRRRLPILLGARDSWSTGAMTRRGSPWGRRRRHGMARTAVGGPGGRRHGRWPSWATHRGAPHRDARRHRSHPLGDPRRPDGGERPPPPRLQRTAGGDPQRDHREPRRARAELAAAGDTSSPPRPTPRCWPT